jgi:5-methylcytosine-specific restriction endonuclease McrA
MKKHKPFNHNAAIRGAIRRVFSRSPIVREVLMEGRREIPKFNKDGSRSKKDAVQYQCQICSSWVSSTKIAVDHIDPVISVDDGFVDWNTFVERLGFENKKNLQRICDDCHNKKTNAERFKRNFAVELNELADMESVKPLLEEKKKWLKKFNKKRFERFSYPQDFIDRINALKRRVGIKV